MTFTARLLTLLAVIFFLAGCVGQAPTAPRAAPAVHLSDPSDALQASPHQLVGRILALDATSGFAFVALTAEPPAAALAASAELIARTDDLRETARLLVSPYVRGRTLGTRILSGQPTPGDEVVFRSP